MGKRKTNKPTPNQVEYSKQVKRIKQFIRRAEKRGYRFESDIIPSTPQRVTKQAIQRLKDLTPQELYKKSTTIDYDTGEIIEGTLGRELERKEVAKKSAETRKRNKNRNNQPPTETGDKYYPDGGEIILDNIVDDLISRLQEPDPPVYPFRSSLARRMEDLIRTRRESKTTLLSLTNSVINEIGKSALGWRLQARADEVDQASTALLYKASSSEEVMSACRHLAEIIKNAPLTMSELQDISEQEEYNQGYEAP